MLRFKKHDKEDRESSPSDDKGDRKSRRDHDSNRSSDSHRHSRRRSRSASPRRRRSRERRPRSRSNERRSRRSRSRSPSDRRTSRRGEKQPEKKKTSASDTGDKSKAQALKVTGRMIEIECNDRLGKKIRVKASPKDTIGDFKKLVAAQIGTEARKIVLKKWYKEFRDHITLDDYELHDGMNVELYYR